MKLYAHPVSGHSHRAQLFLSLAGVAHEVIYVDLMKGEHKKPEFLALNTFGQVPVLDDEGTIVSDSNAILVYVAKKLGLTQWYPDTPTGAAEVQRWLSVAAGQLAYGPGAARLVTLLGAPFDADAVIKRAHQLYALVEAVLEHKSWLASDNHPTLADIAFYSYTHSAPEGNVDLEQYPRIRALLGRVEALPGFVPFASNPIGLRAS